VTSPSGASYMGGGEQMPQSVEEFN